MTTQVFLHARADVVLREDVIESSGDPKPNAFYDSRTGILRVYHGPIYGNPFATLVSTKAQCIGTFAPHLDQSMTEYKIASNKNVDGELMVQKPQENSGNSSNNLAPKRTPDTKHLTTTSPRKSNSLAGADGTNVWHDNNHTCTRESHWDSSKNMEKCCATENDEFNMGWGTSNDRDNMKEAASQTEWDIPVNGQGNRTEKATNTSWNIAVVEKNEPKLLRMGAERRIDSEGGKSAGDNRCSKCRYHERNPGNAWGPGVTQSSNYSSGW